MRVLIADDEYLARSSLRSMLGELGLPIEIVGEAADGEEMVELVRRHAPELVFVDIHMPRLNGLAAIKAARTASPQTRWLILTGYPEFSYAQEAIRLGVSQYLLKPVDPQELRELLRTAIRESREAALLRNRQFEHDVMALAHGLTSLARESEDSIILSWHFAGALFCIDSHLPEDVAVERQLGFCRALQAIAGRASDGRARVALFALPSGELATVGAWDPAHEVQSRPFVWSYLAAVEQAARQASGGDLAVTVLLSEECASFQALQAQSVELQRLAPLRVLCGIGGALHLPVLRQHAGRPGWLEFSRLIVSACRCYREGAYAEYRRTLESCARSLGDVTLGGDAGQRGAVAGFVGCSIGCRATPDQSASAWAQTLAAYGERMLAESPRRDDQGAGIVEQVVSLVDHYYMQDIGIGQIAEQLHITPNYLSTLFHRQMGTTFMKYLTRARMLRAKELLADPHIQVQQVAQLVGYVSARYFAKLFAEFAGCYPSEYRDRLKLS